MPVNLKKDDMGDVVKDFYKSDAPQFKGKSKKKRREMAIAAKLSANENFDHKIDPKEFKKDKRNAKIGNLARKTKNPGEKSNAEKFSKGPKLFGEGKLDKIMNIVRKYSKPKKKKPTPHQYPPGASGGDAGRKAADVVRDREHKKYVNFLPAPK